MNLRRPASPVPAATDPDPGWLRAVSGYIASGRDYPEEARRRGEEGRVTLRFTVERSGRVTEASVAASSGSAALDAAALTLLRRAALPPFPSGMTQARITITSPVRYTLR